MKLLSIFFSPFVFGIGFITPLIAQILMNLTVIEDPIFAYVIGLAIGSALGLMAQFRGSWLWIR